MSPPSPASVAWFDRVALAGLRARGLRSRWLDSPLGPVHLLEGEGQGELPPILLLHGLGSCASDFGGLLLRLLPRHRRVLALDLPGHGLSAHPPAELGPRAIAERLFQGLDVLSDEPMLVFGNSLGGLVALLLARARPEQVRALMLASPAGAPMGEDELARFLEGFDFPTHGHALAFVHRFRTAPGPERHVLAWGLRRRFTRGPIPEILRRVRPEDLLRPDELAEVRAPVLLFWGREDRVLPPEQATFFQSHLPSVQVQEAEGFGHAPFLDQPRAFAARLHAFARAA